MELFSIYLFFKQILIPFSAFFKTCGKLSFAAGRKQKRIHLFFFFFWCCLYHFEIYIEIVCCPFFPPLLYLVFESLDLDINFTFALPKLWLPIQINMKPAQLYFPLRTLYSIKNSPKNKFKSLSTTI